MFGLIVLALLVVPIVELYVIVQVSDALGFGQMLVLLVGLSLLGGLLLRTEGTGVLRRIRTRTAAGEMPSSELLDGALIVIGGALMLTPGFVTDVFGMTLIFPPTRAAYRGVAGGYLKRRVRVYTGPLGGDTRRRGDVVDVDGRPDGPEERGGSDDPDDPGRRSLGG